MARAGDVASVVRLVRPHLRFHSPLVVALAVLVPLGVARQIGTPLLLRHFIDGAVAGRSSGQLSATALAFLAVVLAGQGVDVLTATCASRLSWSACCRLRDSLVRHCLGLDRAFFSRYPPGALVDRLNGDVNRLSAVLSGLVVGIAGQVLLVAGALVGLFMLDWRFGVVFTPVCVGTLVLLRRFIGRAMPHVAARREAGADLAGYLDERLAGAEDVRGSGAVGYAVHGLRVRQAEQYAHARRAARVGVLWPTTTQGLSAVSICLALALGSWLHATGRMSVGTVFAALSYALLVRGPLMTITARFQDVEESMVSVSRLRALGEERSQLVSGSRQLPAAGALGVDLAGVTFGYEHDHPVLRDVSLALRPGERLGVVGRTGSGKTTLVRLLFRMYDPAAGTVRISGRDVRDLELGELRCRIALVTQDVHVLQAPLRDNLTLFRSDVDDERLRWALDQIGLGAWLHSLPDGLDTVLGEPATGLSAGQQQLLALARAFLSNPGLVLLDEPSSRLDPHTEELLCMAIDRFLTGRTAVLVAHRIRTLERVDRIVVFRGGRAVEQGSREELAADPRSAFAALIRSGDLNR